MNEWKHLTKKVTIDTSYFEVCSNLFYSFIYSLVCPFCKARSVHSNVAPPVDCDRIFALYWRSDRLLLRHPLDGDKRVKHSSFIHSKKKKKKLTHIPFPFHFYANFRLTIVDGEQLAPKSNPSDCSCPLRAWVFWLNPYRRSEFTTTATASGASIVLFNHPSGDHILLVHWDGCAHSSTYINVIGPHFSIVDLNIDHSA